MHQKIDMQQTVKFDKSIAEQVTKTARGIKRDCTEGSSCDYGVHICSEKKEASPGRFTPKRTKKLSDLLRNQSTD